MAMLLSAFVNLFPNPDKPEPRWTSNIERPTSNVEWEKAANREPLNRERLLNSFAVRLSVRLSSRRSLRPKPHAEAIFARILQLSA